MFQLSRSTVLGLGMVAALLTACQQQKETDAAPVGVAITTATGLKQQLSTPELIVRLAQDPLLQQFVQANRAFVGKHDAWIASLSATEKAQRRQALAKAHTSGKGWDELITHYGTPAEEAQHHASQQALVEQLKVKYNLDKLSDEARSKVIRKASQLIRQQSQGTANETSISYRG